MAKAFPAIHAEFSIANENDSGRWWLLIHLVATDSGRRISTAPVYWFMNKHDALYVLDHIPDC